MGVPSHKNEAGGRRQAGIWNLDRWIDDGTRTLRANFYYKTF